MEIKDLPAQRCLTLFWYADVNLFTSYFLVSLISFLYCERYCDKCFKIFMIAKSVTFFSLCYQYLLLKKIWKYILLPVFQVTEKFFQWHCTVDYKGKWVAESILRTIRKMGCSAAFRNGGFSEEVILQSRYTVDLFSLVKKIMFYEGIFPSRNIYVHLSSIWSIGSLQCSRLYLQILGAYNVENRYFHRKFYECCVEGLILLFCISHLTFLASVPYWSAQQVQHLGESSKASTEAERVSPINIMGQIRNAEAVLQNNELSIAVLFQKVTYMVLYFSLLCSGCDFLQFIASVF